MSPSAGPVPAGSESESPDNRQDPPFSDRRGSVLQRVVAYLAPVMPFVLAAWLMFASVPLGGPGDRALIWLGALAVPLGLLLWIAGGLILVDLAHYRPRFSRPLTTWLTVATWFGAICLGFFLPDLIDGRGQSLFTALAGPDSVGLSAGFANTVGVLSFAGAAAAVLSAALDLRATRTRLRGGTTAIDPDDEDRLREQWVTSFQNPQDFAREYGRSR